MFGMSIEHLLLLGIVLLFVGPRKLPELGNSIGKGIRNFKDALSGVEEAKFRRLEEETAKTSAAGQQAAQPLVTPQATPVDHKPDDGTGNGSTSGNPS